MAARRTTRSSTAAISSAHPPGAGAGVLVPPPPPYIFVTVGTTSFDALIEAAASPAFAAVARQMGVPRVVLQIGRGAPPSLRHTAEPLAAADSDDGMCLASFSRYGVSYSAFRLAPTTAPWINGAACVVSHAGAGSIFETLRRADPPPLLVVTNPALADNHQEELAGALAAGGHLFTAAACEAESVASALRGCLVHAQFAAGSGAFQPLPPRRGDLFIAALDAVMARDW